VEIAGFGITALIVAGAVAIAVAAYLYWRHVWFWRNPPRIVPAVQGLVSAADGVVVYVKQFHAAEDVIHVKQGLAARLADIVREDAAPPKLLIGVFMSPFDVHFNRAPLSGMIEFVRHYPGQNAHMGSMHGRVLMGREPYYKGSVHVVQNERTVTKINGTLRGAELSCYIVQIAAKTVAGIDIYVKAGALISRGTIFGMIRIGSQVDVVVHWNEAMHVCVRPGDRVCAGETVLID